MNWHYKNEIFTEEMIQHHIGFVYKITNTLTGCIYFGQKHFYSTTKSRLKSNYGKKVTKMSNWVEYWGSSVHLKKDIAHYGEGMFTREILSLHCSQRELSLEECKLILFNDCLHAKNSNGEYLYYNRAIRLHARR